MNEADSCSPIVPPNQQELAKIERMLGTRRITIVGASDNPARASYAIAAYLIEQQYEVVAVNPNHATVLDLPCYASLAEVPGRIDVVNVFRRPEACAEVAREAIARGATGLWLQSGITSREAKRLAEEAGIEYVENRCIMVEHARRR